jgi:hypothetical protein
MFDGVGTLPQCIRGSLKRSGLAKVIVMPVVDTLQGYLCCFPGSHLFPSSTDLVFYHVEADGKSSFVPIQVYHSFDLQRMQILEVFRVKFSLL